MSNPSNPNKRVRSQKPEQDAWVIRWKDYRGKWRTRVRRGPKRKAELWLLESQKKTEDIRDGYSPPPIKLLSMAEVHKNYLAELRAKSRSDDTITRYTGSYTAFKKSVSGTIQIKDITQHDIHRFRSARLDSDTCSPVGVNIDLKHLKAFFRWAYKNDYIDNDLFRNIEISYEIKPVRFLTAEEIIRLLEVIESKPDVKDMVMFYLLSGARPSELLPSKNRFTWDNIEAKRIRLIGKREKVRYVPLHPGMKEILDRRRGLGLPYPFPYEYNTMYDRIVRVAMTQAGLDDTTYHTLRQTTGALLVQAGHDIYRVSRFLGHSSVTVTEKHYVGLRHVDFWDMADSLSTILRSDIQMIYTECSKMEQPGVVINRINDEILGSQVVHATDAGASMAMIINNLRNSTRDRNRTGTALKAEGF